MGKPYAVCCSARRARRSRERGAGHGVVDRPPDVVDGEPLGGARVLRGTTGATAFSILDAPDLSKDTSLLDRCELAEVGRARYVPGDREMVADRQRA